MKNCISEGRALYEDYNHGLFSKRLAEWAISKMEVEDETSGLVKALKPHSIEEMKDVLKANGIAYPEEFVYTAWYLYNMAFADYPKTLTTDKQRAFFVDETLCDPDGDPTNVLECFVAKMCNAGKPIWWEEFI